MATFIAIEYEDPHKAHEVRLALVRLQREYLIDLEDAVLAVKDPQGKVKLHQSFNLTATGAFSGGFWGSLIGLLFLSPLLGAVIGASAGAVSGGLSDVGINDTFMKQLAEGLPAEHIGPLCSGTQGHPRQSPGGYQTLRWDGAANLIVA